MNDLGALHFRFPRLLNTRLMIILGTMAVLIAGPAFAAGEWLVAIAVILSIGSVPLMFLGLKVVIEFAKWPTVETVHADGLVWRKAWKRGVVRWNELSAVRRKEIYVNGVHHSTVWHLRRRESEKLIVLDQNDDAELAAEFIAEQLAN